MSSPCSLDHGQRPAHQRRYVSTIQPQQGGGDVRATPTSHATTNALSCRRVRCTSAWPLRRRRPLQCTSSRTHLCTPGRTPTSDVVEVLGDVVGGGGEGFGDAFDDPAGAGEDADEAPERGVPAAAAEFSLVARAE